MANHKPKFVLCWHMHQPWYRESQEGMYRLPWVYLHAIKDYADMAAHLEAHPRMRTVVNFTPVLLDQIDDYVRQLGGWLQAGRGMSEPLLNLLVGVDPVPSDLGDRAELVIACSRAHPRHMIDVYPAYRELLDYAMDESGAPRAALLPYLGAQYFVDLLVWYHIAWLGYSVRRRAEVKQLSAKGGQFDAGDRRALLAVIHETIAGLIGRYRTLAERGQVELSMTPYAHPIVPLLIDFEAMACSQPQAPRPESANYPGGLQRSRWHVEKGLEVFEAHFGRRPDGVWLSEGGISDAAVQLLDTYGISWTASGEGVWANSARPSGSGADSPDRRSLFRCHALPGCSTRLFFRDDGLSDLIGFEYQQWDPKHAARDFVKHVRNIVEFIDGDPGEHVISVILDGENAWEYYPENGHHFLDALYAELTACDAIDLSTFGEAARVCAPNSLKSLCAGSWVYGSFSTWIGEADKNRAWDCLVAAKQRFDERMAAGGLPPRVARDVLEGQLAICEGSDWFWWFGDYNPAASVRDFDRLFRRQLVDLYCMLGDEPPEALHSPLSSGGGQAELGGAMRRGIEH